LTIATTLDSIGDLKPKQDPIAFAQGTIHELAYIRATVDMLAHFVIDDMADRRGINKEEFHALFRSEVEKKSRKFYAHYSKKAGVAVESE
jgi:hypothetical protein